MVPSGIEGGAAARPAPGRITVVARRDSKAAGCVPTWTAGRRRESRWCCSGLRDPCRSAGSDPAPTDLLDPLVLRADHGQSARPARFGGPARSQTTGRPARDRSGSRSRPRPRGTTKSPRGRRPADCAPVGPKDGVRGRDRGLRSPDYCARPAAVARRSNGRAGGDAYRGDDAVADRAAGLAAGCSPPRKAVQQAIRTSGSSTGDPLSCAVTGDCRHRAGLRPAR